MPTTPTQHSCAARNISRLENYCTNTCLDSRSSPCLCSDSHLALLPNAPFSSSFVWPSSWLPWRPSSLSSSVGSLSSCRPLNSLQSPAAGLHSHPYPCPGWLYLLHSSTSRCIPSPSAPQFLNPHSAHHSTSFRRK